MTISEEIDRIAKRLLADVDDRMEFAGTGWKSKEQASKGVQEALDRHNAQLLELIEKDFVPKDRLKEVCDMAEGVNLEYHGRPDCKNCSLLETIQDMLLKQSEDR